MMPSIPDKTRALRDEAWQGVTETDVFLAFKALDDAVVRMGGTSRIVDEGVPSPAPTSQVYKALVRRMTEHRRLSHAEAAEIALREAKQPLQTPQLLDAAKAAGAEIGGNDPLNNFRSTISKDDRFNSVKKSGSNYWWITGLDLPSGWNEPEPLDLEALLGSGPSVSSSKEGGDGHGPATT